MRRGVGAVAVLILFSAAAAAIEADLTYIDDITSLTGACYVRTMALDAVDEEEEASTLEGILSLAASQHRVRVRPTEEAADLWVDLDGSGELTQTEWERALVDGTLLANVQLELTYGDGSRSPYRLFLMWNPHTIPRPTRRPAPPAFGSSCRRPLVDICVLTTPWTNASIPTSHQKRQLTSCSTTTPFCRAGR